MITATRPGNGRETLTDGQPQDALAEAEQNTDAVIRLVTTLQNTETVDDAVAVTLETIRDAFGWAYGSFWRIDEQANALKFDSESGSVNEEFRRVTQEATFLEGVGLSGRAWKQRELLFVEDIGTVTDCCRAPVAQRAGVKSGICFPIFLNGRPFGTIDFFATETLTMSETRMSVLRNVGALLIASLDRLELQEAAVQTQNMMDNVPINVVFANRNLDITYVNPASVKTLRQLEHLLPVPIDQIVGSNVDLFHKNPEMQRRILNNPDNLPHRAKIKLGEETLDLSVCAIYDKNRNYIGPMVTWEIVTDRVKLADDVMQGVAVVASSATELQANSKTMASTAEETSRQSQVVAAASEEATRNVETVSSATEELTASIIEISRHVQDASKISGQAVEEAETTNKTIAELGEASQEIGQVIKVITSIAQQTNLLALNATIEAARAGEAGKGFAVVANEVKELARQTANATEEISQKIGAIQSSTGVAVSAIGSIGETIGKINEIATTIASAVEEQTAATNEISRNVSEAAKGTAEVSSNIGGVAQAADESGKASADILTAADSLAQEAVRLEQVVKGFVN